MKITERQRLAALYASLAVVVFGASGLIQAMSLDYYTVLGTLQKIIPAAFVLGLLGWVMGAVIEKPSRKKGASYDRIATNDEPKIEMPED